jgi:L,D-transpeptidase YcbB
VPSHQRENTLHILAFIVWLQVLIMKNKKFLILIVSIWFSIQTPAQISRVQLQQFISIEKNLKSLAVVHPELAAKFYEDCGYQLMWVNDEAANNRLIFFEDLDRADDLALNSKDYHYEAINQLRQGKKLLTIQDSLRTDWQITDAAIHFYSEVIKGNKPPGLSYDGLKYTPDISGIPFLVTEYLSKNQLQRLVSDLEPKSKEYNHLKNRLIHFNRVIKKPGFTEVIITSSKVDSTNGELILKLYQLGLFDTLPEHVTSKEVKQKLQSAQKLFSQSNDGQLPSTTRQVLNVPLSRRKKELVLAINYIRWLNEIKNKEEVIVLNIPSTTLFAYDRGKMVLDSRVIVGKPSTRTPTLSSKINEVIMYPYWNVPIKIATKELLPSIKKDAGFLERNGFQVLSKQEKILDPDKIDWYSLSASNFPYRIRQSTGCDNSLGIVKLNFYNPFTVYIHDTPGKGLFFLNKRYFSHGCMRIEKAIELAKLVASNQATTIDAIESKGCTLNQAPLRLPADKPMHLIVLYSTVWYDVQGSIAFFDDVYGKL